MARTVQIQLEPWEVGTILHALQNMYKEMERSELCKTSDAEMRRFWQTILDDDKSLIEKIERSCGKETVWR